MTKINSVRCMGLLLLLAVVAVMVAILFPHVSDRLKPGTAEKLRRSAELSDLYTALWIYAEADEGRIPNFDSRSQTRAARAILGSATRVDRNRLRTCGWYYRSAPNAIGKRLVDLNRGEPFIEAVDIASRGVLDSLPADVIVDTLQYDLGWTDGHKER